MEDRYGLHALFSFQIDPGAQANIRSIQGQLNKLQQTIKNLSKMTGAGASGLNGAIASMGGKNANTSNATQTSLQGLKALKAELRALRAESKLIDFGDLTDPQAFKKADQAIEQYIGDLKRLEQQVDRNTIEGREFAATLKNQQRMAQKRRDIAITQRDAAQDPERSRVAQLAKQSKGLKAELRALRAEARLIDFGDITDPQAFKKADRELEKYIEDLKRLEKQVDRNTAEGREFAATLKNQQGIAQGRRDIAKAQRDAVAASEKLGVAVLAKQTGDALFTPIKNFATGAMDIYANFDDRMSAVSAITTASGEKLDQLREKAKTLGATTRFTASDAAEAMTFLGMAGFKTEAILAGVGATLNLASAGQLGLAEAADISSNVLSGFMMQVEQLDHVTDVLARTATSANTNIQQMGVAMSYAAPNAKMFGASMEETSALIGVMSNAGIQADKAGTASRSAFLKLATAKSSPKALKALEGMGITLTDAKGNMRNIVEIMDELAMKSGINTMSPDDLVRLKEAGGDIAAIEKIAGSDRIAAFKDIFGTTGISGAAAALGQMEEFKRLSLANYASSVETAKMAEYLKSQGIKIGKNADGTDEDPFATVLKQFKGRYSEAQKIVEEGAVKIRSAELSFGFSKMDEGSLEKLKAALGVQTNDIFGEVVKKAGGVEQAFIAIQKAANQTGVELRKPTGAALKMAIVMEDNLAGSFRSLGSAWEAVQLNLFEPIAPLIREAVNALTKLALYVANLPKPVRMLIGVGGLLTFMAAGLLVAGGAVGIMLLGWQQAAATAAVSMAALGRNSIPLTGFYSTAMQAITSGTALTSVLNFLKTAAMGAKTAFTGMLGPVGIAIAVLGAVYLGVKMLYPELDVMGTVLKFLGNVWKGTIGILRNAFASFRGFVEFLQQNGGVLLIFTGPVGLVVAGLKSIYQAIRSVNPELGGMGAILGAIGGLWNTAFSVIGNAVSGFATFVMSAFSIAADFVTNAWNGAVSRIKEMFGWLIEPALAIAQGLINALNHNPTERIPEAWEGAMYRITDSLNWLIEPAMAIAQWLVQTLSTNPLPMIVQGWNWAVTGIWGALSGLMQPVLSMSQWLTDTLIFNPVQTILNGWNWGVEQITGIFQTLPTIASAIGTELANIFDPQKIFGRFMEGAKGLLKIGGIGKMIPGLGDWLNGVESQKAEATIPEPTINFEKELQVAINKATARKDTSAIESLKLLQQSSQGTLPQIEYQKLTASDSDFQGSQYLKAAKIDIRRQQDFQTIKQGITGQSSGEEVKASIKNLVLDSTGGELLFSGAVAEKRQEITALEKSIAEIKSLQAESIKNPGVMGIGGTAKPTKEQLDYLEKAESKLKELQSSLETPQGKFFESIGIDPLAADTAVNTVRSALSEIKEEWNDRMSFYERGGSLEEAIAPGLEQMSSGFNILGGDIQSFAGRSFSALLKGDFQELSNAASDFGGNVQSSLGIIMQGFASARMSVLAFGVASLLSLSPMTLTLLGAAFAVFALSTNFLGLRTILVGLFKVAQGIVTGVIALVEIVVNSLKAIGMMLDAIRLGDLQLFKTGFRALFDAIVQGASKLANSFKQILGGALQVVKGAFQGVGQIARNVFKIIGIDVMGLWRALTNLKVISAGIKQGFLSLVSAPKAAWQGFKNLIQSIITKVKELVQTVTGGLSKATEAVKSSPIGQAVRAVKKRVTGQETSMENARQTVQVEEQLKPSEPQLKKGLFGGLFGKKNQPASQVETVAATSTMDAVQQVKETQTTSQTIASKTPVNTTLNNVQPITGLENGLQQPVPVAPRQSSRLSMSLRAIKKRVTGEETSLENAWKSVDFEERLKGNDPVMSPTLQVAGIQSKAQEKISNLLGKNPGQETGDRPSRTGRIAGGNFNKLQEEEAQKRKQIIDDGINESRNAMAAVANTLGSFAPTLAAPLFAISALTDGIAAIGDTLPAIKNGFAAIAPTLMGIATGAAGAIQSTALWKGLVSAATWVSTGFASLAATANSTWASIVTGATTSGGVMELFNTAVTAVNTWLSTTFASLTASASSTWASIVSGVAASGEAMGILSTIVAAASTWISTNFAALTATASSTWASIVSGATTSGGVMGLFGAITTAINTSISAGFAALTATASSAWASIVSGATTSGGVMGLFGAITTAINTSISAGFAALTATASSAWASIVSGATTSAGAVGTFAATSIPASAGISAAFTAISAAASAAWVAITGPLLPLVALLGGVAIVLGGVYLAFKNNFLGIGSLFKGLIDGVKSIFAGAWNFIGGIFRTIESIIFGVGNALKGIVMAFIEPLTGGAWDIVLDVFSTIQEVASEIGAAFNEVGQTLMEPFKPLFEAFGWGGGDGIGELIKGVVSILLSPLRVVAEALKLIIRSIGLVIVGAIKLGGAIASVVLLPMRGLMVIFQGVVGLVRMLWSGISAVGNAVSNILLAPFRLVWQIVQGIGGFLQKIPFVGNWLGGGTQQQTTDIPRFASGGLVTGPGSGTADKIPALISNGEFVVNAAATRNNLGFLEAINSGVPAQEALELLPMVPPPLPIPVASAPAAAQSPAATGETKVELVLNFGDIHLHGASTQESATEFLEAIGPKLEQMVVQAMRQRMEFMR